MSFTSEQLARVAPLWERMLGHRFLTGTREGTIAHETFSTWMRQDYLFVESAIPFIAALLSKAPRAHWEPLSDVLGMLQKELKLFRERADAAGVDLGNVRPAFVNDAYIRFLMAAALGGTYPEGYTVLYVAEKAYHDSWKRVREGIDRDSPWLPFVENWASDAFADYVDYLQDQLDGLAERVGPDERARMAELFELTVRYEIAFWEMAATGGGWPGIPESRAAEGT